VILIFIFFSTKKLAGGMAKRSDDITISIQNPKTKVIRKKTVRATHYNKFQADIIVSQEKKLTAMKLKVVETDALRARLDALQKLQLSPIRPVQAKPGNNSSTIKAMNGLGLGSQAKVLNPEQIVEDVDKREHGDNMSGVEEEEEQTYEQPAYNHGYQTPGLPK
jgi:uncharacterized protein with von Willebrand factor type A (vWA) domain